MQTCRWTVETTMETVWSSSLPAERIAALKKDHTKDLKIDDCISNFLKQLKSEHVYRIRYFTDLGKINFSTKIDYRIKLHLKTDMKKLFESQKLLASGRTIPTPDVKLFLQKLPLSNISKFCWVKILDST